MNPRAEASMSMPPPRQTRGRVLLFAARILPDQTRETAIFRLHGLRRLYNSIYGETNTRCLYHIFANRRPDLPLDRRFYGPHSLGDGYFSNLLDIVKDSSLELEIVLHGWCAMTTDPLTFVGLFGHISHKTKLMIFDFILYTSSMKFYEPNVQEMCQVFAGLLPVEQASSETAKAICHFRAHNAMAFPIGDLTIEDLAKGYPGNQD